MRGTRESLTGSGKVLHDCHRRPDLDVLFGPLLECDDLNVWEGHGSTPFRSTPDPNHDAVAQGSQSGTSMIEFHSIHIPFHTYSIPYISHSIHTQR